MKDINKLNKEREIIEKNCEKLRRTKEAEMEKIQSEVVPKSEEIKRLTDGLNKQAILKETEFAQKKGELLEEHRVLKCQFNKYDEEKTKLLCKWAKSAKESFNKELLEYFPHMKKDVIYVQGLEKKHEEFQMKTFHKMGEIESIQKQIDEIEKNKYSEKQELLYLQSLVRKLPYKTQMLIRKEFLIKKQNQSKENDDKEKSKDNNYDKLVDS